MKFNLVNQIFEIDSNDNAKRLFFSGDTQESFEWFDVCDLIKLVKILLCNQDISFPTSVTNIDQTDIFCGDRDQTL